MPDEPAPRSGRKPARRDEFRDEDRRQHRRSSPERRKRDGVVERDDDDSDRRSTSPATAARGWRLVGLGHVAMIIAAGIFGLSMLVAAAQRIVIATSDVSNLRSELNALVALSIGEIVLKLLGLLGWLGGRFLVAFTPAGRGRPLAVTAAGLACGAFLLAATGIVILAIEVRSSPANRPEPGLVVVGALLPVLGFGLVIAAEFVAIAGQLAIARRLRDRVFALRSKLQMVGLAIVLGGSVIGFCLFRGVSNLAETKDETNFGYGKLVTTKKDLETERTLVAITGAWLVLGVGGYCLWSALTYLAGRSASAAEASRLTRHNGRARTKQVD